ncbi:hypothetical protein G7B40_035835 [Aetokthonos hydrillicola Thurmond2011]|uniref:Uncharacterized protein n=1 Tax=Aetokthonos hydrillicola Thurmond2011 TaxID=2712845 RepID=A0AAP5IG66_9CYAN|nr:hypothetical protein [Aetokthonos hydrillicola]MBO3460737.1 hypothetical protein [Aetokthonos hydrillicola CCALA 1050]MBW4586404.1 hypothetical protein [Aetokthonos hydrillicola CCALA 1050]MDR9899889.1 hypothetical protein [Aetokthonos hydrillicola Thurmond2011]
MVLYQEIQQAKNFCDRYKDSTVISSLPNSFACGDRVLTDDGLFGILRANAVRPYNRIFAQFWLKIMIMLPVLSYCEGQAVVVNF